MFDRPAAGRAWFERNDPRSADTRRPGPSRGHVRPARLVVEPRAGFTPRSSTEAWSQRSRSTSALRRSSSTSKRAARCGPRRPSTTPATSASAADSPHQNWEALVQVGHQINQRLLDHQLPGVPMRARRHDASARGAAIHEDGLPAPGLRFGEPRTMALLACLCCFQHLFAGLTNRSLRELIAGLIPGYTSRQMTYDLRRLRRKGFIQRIPRTQRTSSPARDADWPSSSPRPTRGSSTHPSPNSTPHSQPEIAAPLTPRQRLARVRARPPGPNQQAAIAA